jgi:hypothetical protein
MNNLEDVLCEFFLVKVANLIPILMSRNSRSTATLCHFNLFKY